MATAEISTYVHTLSLHAGIPCSDISGFLAAGEFEYGNYDSKKVKGMINLPIGDTLGVRVAGVYLNRNGYTKNLYDNSRIDGRNLYSLRGTLSWEPTSDTRLDLIAYYFHEKDDRSRIQKQLCRSEEHTSELQSLMRISYAVS